MDLLKSFRLGRRGTPSVRLHRLDAAAKLPFPRRPPHGISLSSEARQLLREASFQFKEGSTFPRRVRTLNFLAPRGAKPLCRSSPQDHMKASLNPKGLVCGVYPPMRVRFPRNSRWLSCRRSPWLRSGR